MMLYDTAPLTAHSLLIFHPWQVQSTTTTACTIPTTSDTPILSQQLGSTRLASLDTTTTAFTHADHSLLHVMSPISTFNEFIFLKGH